MMDTKQSAAASMARLALSAELPFSPYCTSPSSSSTSSSTSSSCHHSFTPSVRFRLSTRLRKHCEELQSASSSSKLTPAQRELVAQLLERVATAAARAKEARAHSLSAVTGRGKSVGPSGTSVPKVWPLPREPGASERPLSASQPSETDIEPPSISFEEVNELLRAVNAQRKEPPEKAYTLDDLLHDTSLYIPSPPAPVPDPERRKNFQKLVDEYENRKYAAMVKSVVRTQKDQEFMDRSQFRDLASQMKIAVRVIITMATLTTCAWWVFDQAYGRRGGIIGGVLGLTVGMFVEIGLFIVRAYRVDMAAIKQTKKMKRQAIPLAEIRSTRRRAPLKPLLLKKTE